MWKDINFAAYNWSGLNIQLVFHTVVAEFVLVNCTVACHICPCEPCIVLVQLIIILVQLCLVLVLLHFVLVQLYFVLVQLCLVLLLLHLHFVLVQLYFVLVQLYFVLVQLCFVLLLLHLHFELVQLYFVLLQLYFLPLFLYFVVVPLYFAVVLLHLFWCKRTLCQLWFCFSSDLSRDVHIIEVHAVDSGIRQSTQEQDVYIDITANSRNTSKRYVVLVLKAHVPVKWHFHSHRTKEGVDIIVSIQQSAFIVKA